MRTLDVEFDKRRESGQYEYGVDVRQGGREHVYTAVNPPKVGRYWGAQIGSVTHALRSSLEHLAWQLVIANGGCPDDKTTFPVMTDKPKSGRLREISGGVSPDAFAIIEAAQPFNGTDDGRRLAAIHSLDIHDKHKELVVTVPSIQSAITHGPAPLPQNSITFTREPMEDGTVVAIIEYLEPQMEPDPNLTLTPYLAFGEDSPYPHEVVTGFIWDLIQFVEDQFVPRFYRCILPTRRSTILSSRFRE